MLHADEIKDSMVLKVEVPNLTVQTVNTVTLLRKSPLVFTSCGGDVSFLPYSDLISRHTVEEFQNNGSVSLSSFLSF